MIKKSPAVIELPKTIVASYPPGQPYVVMDFKPFHVADHTGYGCLANQSMTLLNGMSHRLVIQIENHYHIND